MAENDVVGTEKTALNHHCQLSHSHEPVSSSWLQAWSGGIVALFGVSLSPASSLVNCGEVGEGLLVLVFVVMVATKVS